MGMSIRKAARPHEFEPVSLGELIHEQVRVAIETAVHEELLATLGATPYERSEVRRGYLNGSKERTLTGPTGPLALTLPRAAPGFLVVCARHGFRPGALGAGGAVRRGSMVSGLVSARTARTSQ